jgi:hypothetical protein
VGQRRRCTGAARTAVAEVCPSGRANKCLKKNGRGVPLGTKTCSWPSASCTPISAPRALRWMEVTPGLTTLLVSGVSSIAWRQAPKAATSSPGIRFKTFSAPNLLPTSSTTWTHPHTHTHTDQSAAAASALWRMRRGGGMDMRKEPRQHSCRGRRTFATSAPSPMSTALRMVSSCTPAWLIARSTHSPIADHACRHPPRVRWPETTPARSGAGLELPCVHTRVPRVKGAVRPSHRGRGTAKFKSAPS